MNFATPKRLNSFPTNHLTCLFAQNTRKSNAALLLPHVFAVSPLLRHSYKKIGGGGSLPQYQHQVTQALACVLWEAPLSILNPQLDSPQGASNA